MTTLVDPVGAAPLDAAGSGWPSGPLLGQITRRPLFEPAWVADNADRLWEATLEHLYLTGLSVGIGLTIAMALSLVALRWRATFGPIVTTSGLLYTVPSLALFAFLVPFTGFSTTTAVTALVTYTLLILVRNIVVGIEGVPPEVVEAADGMGLRRVRRLLEVELPLALPVIVAGLRVATVTVIGLVTVTALLGRGGLGHFILMGFRGSRTHPTMILAGVALSVALAIAVDLLLLGLQAALTPWARRRETR